MNTIFKLHLQAWLLASVAAASLGAAAFGTLARPLRRVFAAGLLALAAAAVSTSVAASIGLLRFPKMASPGPSLDGTRYLAERDPDALAAYRFLNRHVVGVPVVLEGIGRPYGDSLRVAMHTGLPAAVGWEPHLLQQARERGEVRRRAAEVDRFYATTDRADAGRILDRLRADFVLVGPLERSRYPAAGLAKFGDWGRLERVFERGGVALYATPGAVAAEKTWRDAAPGSRSGAAGLVYDRAGRAARELEPSGPARRPRALERPSAGRD
jgi:uncharacterized membrane protein